MKMQESGVRIQRMKMQESEFRIQENDFSFSF